MNQILNSIIAKQRNDFESLCANRTVPESAWEGVSVFHNLKYIKDNDSAHRLDLYCPRTAPVPTPVIVNIHGGGLIMGNKEFNQHFCLNLCKLGYLVFSVEYRLCPEATVFQQLQDIYSAMNYIDDMLPQLKAELGQCYLVGDSAGAMLSLYAAAVQRNPKLAQAAGVQPSYLEIRALALISGMFYTTRKDSIGLLFPKAFYGDDYKQHPFYPYLDPEHEEVTTYLPPCMMLTSKCDNLKKYSYNMAAAIRRNGSSCYLRDYGSLSTLTHAFSVFYPELPESREAIDDIASFFNKYE